MKYVRNAIAAPSTVLTLVLIVHRKRESVFTNKILRSCFHIIYIYNILLFHENAFEHRVLNGVHIMLFFEFKNIALLLIV